MQSKGSRTSTYFFKDTGTSQELQRRGGQRVTGYVRRQTWKGGSKAYQACSAR